MEIPDVIVISEDEDDDEEETPRYMASNIDNMPSNLVTEASPRQSMRLQRASFLRRNSIERQITMKGPTEPAKERSKLFNVMYAVFYGSNTIADGYAISMLSPLGEKWITLHFKLIDGISFFYGLTNLVYCIGFIIGIFYAHWGPVKVKRTTSL
jgi:hypothetical protein